MVCHMITAAVPTINNDITIIMKHVEVVLLVVIYSLPKSDPIALANALSLNNFDSALRIWLCQTQCLTLK